LNERVNAGGRGGQTRKRRRVRTYELYALARGGPFTTRTGRYPAWPWIYRVRATSIRQAYYLAAREVFVTSDGVGVLGIDRHGDFPPIRASGMATPA